MKALMGVVFCLFAMGLYAQIDGLWQIDSIRRLGEVSVPPARWFQFQEGEVYGGNGWMINTFGHYSFDEEEGQFAFLEDEMGAYNCRIKEEGMQWYRSEYDMDVTIYLSRVEHYPLAPWDQLRGWWQLTSSSIDDVQGDSLRLYFSWDRKYRIDNGSFGEGNQSGLWHYDAFDPLLRMISHQGDAMDREWEVLFEEDQLVLRTQDGLGELRWMRYNPPPDID